jgi:hypothetical protein
LLHPPLSESPFRHEAVSSSSSTSSSSSSSTMNKVTSEESAEIDNHPAYTDTTSNPSFSCIHNIARVGHSGIRDSFPRKSRNQNPWANEEDKLLTEIVSNSSEPIMWHTISLCLSGRSSKQCRERWSEQLDPRFDRSPYSILEDSVILQSQQKLGNKWKEICTFFGDKQRTPSSVKVRWHFLDRQIKKYGSTSDGLPDYPHISCSISNYANATANANANSSTTATPTSLGSGSSNSGSASSNNAINDKLKQQQQLIQQQTLFVLLRARAKTSYVGCGGLPHFITQPRSIHDDSSSGGSDSSKSGSNGQISDQNHKSSNYSDGGSLGIQASAQASAAIGAKEVVWTYYKKHDNTDTTIARTHTSTDTSTDNNTSSGTIIETGGSIIEEGHDETLADFPSVPKRTRDQNEGEKENNATCQQVKRCRLLSSGL